MTGLSKRSRRWSGALATVGVAAALVIAGCGGTGYSTHAAAAGSPAPTTMAPATTPPSAAKPTASSGSLAGIAQHNGGDQDPDNNGGPNDGDGAL